MPYESLRFLGKGSNTKKYVAKSIVCLFSAISRRRYSQQGFWFPDCFFGLSYSGRLSAELVEDLLQRAPKGKTTEIMTHPGHYDSSVMRRYDYWAYHWEDELRSVTTYSREELENRKGVKLISY
jgi:predicted glycoside hydrolase/deacetylase ChbG (UPF0249 family)